MPAALSCFVIGIGLAVAVDANIALAPAPGTLLFSDNFANDTVGQPPTGWNVVSGTWLVATDGTNVLKQTVTDTSTSKSIFTGATSGTAAWTDYSTQVQLKPGTTNYSLGYTLNARYQDDNNSYSLVLKSGNSFYFGKKVAGVWTTFSSGTFVYNTTTWYTLELDTAGTSIRALINGNQVGSVNDSSFSAGAIDLMARYVGEFSNVVVTALAPPPPPSPSASPSPTASPSSTPSPTAAPSPSTSPSPSASPSPSPAPTPANPGIVNGMVTDSGTGASIAGAQVIAQPGGATTSTDSSGAYQLSLQPGTYNVIVSKAGYNTDFAGGVVVSSGGQTAANVALFVVPAGVSMDLFSRPNQSGVGTASDGTAWLDDRATYPNGTQSIVSRHLLVQTATAWTDLDQWMSQQYADEEVTVDVDMARGNGRVLIRVQNATTWVEFAFNVDTSQLQLWTQIPGNKWNAFATVNNFVLQQNTWYHVKADIAGTTVSAKIWPVGSAEPGWQITGTETAVAGPGMGGLRTAVADDYYANFAVTPITQIGGLVTDSASGKPIAGATVQLSNGASTTTDSTGAYTFAGLAPGTYTVSASATGYNGASQAGTVSVGSGATLNFALVSTNPPPPPPPSPSPGASPSPAASPSPTGTAG